MGATSGAGGAGGPKGAAGGGGQIRRTMQSGNLRPGDEVYFPNPDKREVRKRRKAYQDFIAKGGTPTYERSMAVGNLRATVRKRLGGGKAYDLEVRKGSEKLVPKFSPKVGAGKKRAGVRRVRAYDRELKGGTVLRDGKWRYKVTTS